MERNKLQKLTAVAIMIALDVILSPLMRIEGMAPMSSVMNVLAGVLLGPAYAAIMATVCGMIRMTMLGIPPLALTGSVFGALLAGVGYRWGGGFIWAMVGEVIGTGIIGSLCSYPVMVWFTGSSQGLYWFIYTPRFIGATLIGGTMGLMVLYKLKSLSVFKRVQELFRRENHVRL